jgi:hypothetical protein
MKINRRFVLLVILILALITIFLPIKVNYSFEATALVYSAREWNLKRGADDSYISELVDNETNMVSNLMSYKFERGDVAEVQIRKDLVSGKYVTAKDTIATIHSFFINNEITRLVNLKQIEEAALNVTVTGEKQTLIDQSKQELEFARQQFDLALKSYERQKKLYLDSIISQSEFEVSENQYHLAQITVQIEEKELLSIETGAKSEEIDYIKQKIDSYQREIQTLEDMKEQYFIKSPIEGIISFNRIVDGILTISDTNRYVLKIPVKLTNIHYINSISGIKFSIPGDTEKIDASFICIDENVNLSLSSKQQHILAKALIDHHVTGIYPGMAVACQVYCDDVTIFEFLKRSINLRVY